MNNATPPGHEGIVRVMEQAAEAAKSAIHTPTPGKWRLSESAHQPLRAGIVSESGLHITDVCGYGATDEQNNARAALILRTVNAHDDLLDNLRKLADLASILNDRQHAGNEITPGMWSELYDRCNKAKAAIARAEGE